MAPGAPDVTAVSGIPAGSGESGPFTLRPGQAATALVAAINDCATAPTVRYSSLSVSLPGGGTLVLALSTRDSSGHNLTLAASATCPLHVGKFTAAGP